ncbi:ATP-binding protein [Kitasatospora saccharophila]|uniref:ATP-binding protein n=1 Tax=Kitasatospora saccharophila TaxID=407973 RepID=UPI003624D62A
MVFDRKHGWLVLASGDERERSDFDSFLLHVDDLKAMRPSDLRVALQRVLNDGAEASVNVTRDEGVDTDYSEPEPVRIDLSGGRLVVVVDFATESYGIDDDEQETHAFFASLLEPYLRRNRGSLVAVELDHAYFRPWIWRLTIECSTRNRDVADMFRVGEGALALLTAYDSGELTRETTLDLLRSGQAQVLVGQAEGPWLDVKVQHYDLKTQAGKISIAEAVARFANAEFGGIVVVGMRAKKVPGGEVISSLHPVPVDGRTLRLYQDAIEKHLYPPPDYLDIEVVPADGGSLVVLHIPPQPEELKPFLVHGALVDGEVKGAFISIVRRRGESSIPITAPAIHATLAAGRALLRRGQLPQD